MRPKNTINRIGQVLRLQISELALLLAKLDIEQVVVDLRHQCLQRNAALNPCRRHQRSHNVAWIDECLCRRQRWNCRFFKEPRRMPGCRHLIDPLAKRAPPPHDVEDLRLVPVNLNRAGPKVIGRRVQIHKLSSHVFSSVDFFLP